ncbi:MAG: GGDEF domain-containing protein, partial [Myxococcota bacterium]
AKALEPAVSLQEVLEHTACESAGVLPVEAWALCVTPPGALRKAVATLGEVSVEAAGSLDLADQEQAAVDMGSWWSLVARTDGRPSLTMPLPVRASGHWELVVHLSGEPGCELLTSALSQALIHPLTAAINRICDAEAGKRLALTDPLTGVGNRLGMERALEQLTGSEVPLGVLLLDLNNFKGINDHFGHDLGDEALRRVGQVLRELTRDGLAEVFRLGGDEFVILAPVEARVLELLSTRFRRGIEAIELEVAPGELLPMSTSIGRAWTASLGGNSAELFKAADQDMFTDKRNNPRRQPRGARPRTRRSSCLGAVSRRSVPRLSKLTPMLVVGSGSCGG